MNFKEEVEAVIGPIAAEYAYAKDLQLLFDNLEHQPLSQTQRDVQKAFRLLRWVGRAERRVNRSELQIIRELEGHKIVLDSSESATLLQQLEVVEAKLVKAASLYLGKLRQELKDIETYTELEEKYKQDSVTLRSIEHKLSSLIQHTQQEIAELIKWIQATELILKKLKSTPIENTESFSRRSFLRRFGMAAAGVALGVQSKTVRALEALSEPDREQKLKAVIEACNFIEEFCERQTKELRSQVILTPHADYTHFNRVGEWRHKMILGVGGSDFGAKFEGVFDKQRAEARAALQPTDQEVSIAERSLVTLANMNGRTRIAKANKKLLVPKHFPGGPPQIEYTEVKPIFVAGIYPKLVHLKPFEDLCHQGLAQAMMTSHACYPDLEVSLMGSFYHKYEQPIIKELAFLEWDEQKHQSWIRRRPATLSPTLIRGLLKDKFLFNGVVFSDALYMKGLTALVVNLSMNWDKLKELNPSWNGSRYDAAYQVMAPILAIYAGIDVIILFDPSQIKVIKTFAERSPYFRECLHKAYKKIKEKHQILGLDFPPLDSSQEIDTYFSNSLSHGWVDAWDRGGALHQLFRRKYLSVLYGNDQLLENPKTFWPVHQKTNWSELDPLYEEIIQKKYLCH